MSDGNLLLRVCCSCPTDRDAQLVLADWLQENGEPECEVALRGDADKAADIIRDVHKLADHLKRQPCLKLLFAAVVVSPSLFLRPAPTVPQITYPPGRRTPVRADPAVPVRPGPYEYVPRDRRWRVDHDEFRCHILDEFNKEAE